MQLYTEVSGQGNPFIILHGLFGSGKNWRQIAERLSLNYQVYLVDLRNHGQSPHSLEWGYELMAQDVVEFIKSRSIKQPILLGHSMGGKVAMVVASLLQLKHLIIVDIGPGFYPIREQFILDALIHLDLNSLQNRKQADETLALTIPDRAMRQFLLMNLYQTPEKIWRWRCNLSGIYKHIGNVGQDLSSLLSTKPIRTYPVLFIKGENSDYLNDEQRLLAQKVFPEAQWITMPQVGHWPHIEAKEEFLEILSTQLP